MRYAWYKKEFPDDRFLGRWNEFDLWFDAEDETYVAVYGSGTGQLTSIDKMNWIDMADYIPNSEHREALGMAKERWETPDPSVSPGSRRTD